MENNVQPTSSRGSSAKVILPILAVVVLVAVAIWLAPSLQPSSDLKTAVVGGSKGEVTISTLQPNQGPVETLVTVTGAGFSPTGNAVHFGVGYVPNLPSSNNGTSLQFTVPAGLDPACAFVEPPCKILTQQTTPGVYQVSVANSSGAVSNALPFTVTDSSGGCTYSVGLTAEKNPSVVGAAVQFTANFQSSCPVIPERVLYTWNFGDGATANTGFANTTRHVYAAAGTYTATVSVGTFGTATVQVVVAGASSNGNLNSQQAPMAPSNLTLSKNNVFDIQLAWRDNSSNETGFVVERRNREGGTYAPLATVAANATSYVDTSAASCVWYVYRVKAVNGALSSTYSNEVEGLGGDKCATNSNTNSSGNTFVPTNVVATSAATSSNVFVRWDAVATTRVSKYIVYRSPCTFAGTAGQPCSSYSYTKVGETNGSVVFLDSVSATGKLGAAQDTVLAAGPNSYVYAVSSVVSNVESNQSAPSNAVTVGLNGTGSISSAFVILPYSTDQAVELTAFGLGSGIQWTVTPIYNPSLLRITPQTGNPAKASINVEGNANAVGGVGFVTARDSNNVYATMLVIVWPRGDTDGNFLINALDQNNVAVGWNG